MASTNSHRVLNWEGCLNVRDLGGLKIDDQAQTAYHAFIRADTLSKLMPEGCVDLVAAGVSIIIDLREPDEAAEDPSVFMSSAEHRPPPVYLNLPMFYLEDRSILESLNLPPKPTTIAEAYCAELYIFQKQIGGIISAIASVESGSVVFHCHAGKDRTGVLAALLLALVGVPREIIAADYAETAHHLKPLIEEWLAEFDEGAARQKRAMELGSTPETMLTVLAYLEQKYGGAEAYLLEAGVTENELASIRDRLSASISEIFQEDPVSEATLVREPSRKVTNPSFLRRFRSCASNRREISQGRKRSRTGSEPSAFPSVLEGIKTVLQEFRGRI